MVVAARKLIRTNRGIVSVWLFKGGFGGSLWISAKYVNDDIVV